MDLLRSVAGTLLTSGLAAYGASAAILFRHLSLVLLILAAPTVLTSSVFWAIWAGLFVVMALAVLVIRLRENA